MIWHRSYRNKYVLKQQNKSFKKVIDYSNYNIFRFI